ncbi:ABC transporter permease [Streptomyces sp. NPDC091281]|uniref:ABC transporter permease n=1 Tax=Streptomyces sp. NPDC091281 TaxID=3365985 RepID=UPI00381933A4
MDFTPVLHAEWLKIRTLRSALAVLAAVPLTTVAFSVLAAADSGGDGPDAADPLFTAFFGVSLGQIAAVGFGTAVMAAEFRGGALRVSLAAVPCRGRWFAAKLTALALSVLAAGLAGGFTALAVAGAASGERDFGTGAGLRAAVVCGLYLTLMALLAAGLTALLRSAPAALGILAPLLLIVSFVVGDLSSGLADLLPDRAGQVALHSAPYGTLGPWSGLAVTALWTAAVLAPAAHRLCHRDA